MKIITKIVDIKVENKILLSANKVIPRVLKFLSVCVFSPLPAVQVNKGFLLVFVDFTSLKSHHWSSLKSHD